MNKQFQSELRIENLCRANGFSAYIVMKKTKRILDQFRDAHGIKNCLKDEEELVIKRLVLAVREKYRQSYIKRHNHKTGSLDYLLLDVIGTEWADEVVAEVFSKMADFDRNTEDYTNIIVKYYFAKEPLDDVSIQVEMDLPRSTYYRMKRQAIILFGILLWTTVIDMCVGKDFAKAEPVF